MRRLPVLLAIVPLALGCGSTGPSGFVTPTAEPASQTPVVAAASAAGTAATGDPSAPGFIVIRAGQGTPADGLVTVNPVSGRIMARLPIGAPDASWTALYVATPAAAGTGSVPSTVIRALDPRTGAELRRTQLVGDWRLPTVVPDALPASVTADGRRLVLVDAAPGAAQSRFALLSTAFDGPPTLVTLDGRFDFDATSASGLTLYLIEHLAAGSGDYQVRSYEVGSERLSEGPIVDKRDLEASMAGRPVARAVSDDGAWVETVYVRADGTAFVHQLDATQAVALCVDLPDEIHAGSDVDAAGWRIALAGTGSGFVANGRLGFLASLQTGGVETVAASGSEPVRGLLGDRSGRGYVLESHRLARLDHGLVPTAALAIEGRAVAINPDASTMVVETYSNALTLVDVSGAELVARGSVSLDAGIDWTNARLMGFAGPD